MTTSITTLLNTLISTPARFVAERVRHYSARLGRWISACNPIPQLNTPVNRAIRDGQFRENFWTENGSDPRWMESSLDMESALPYSLFEEQSRFESRAPGSGRAATWSLLDPDGQHLATRTDLQHRVDTWVAPLLRWCLPRAPEAEATPASSPDASAEHQPLLSE